jgi:ABC-type amino acid transport substrate-binding protein
MMPVPCRRPIMFPRERPEGGITRHCPPVLGAILIRRELTDGVGAYFEFSPSKLWFIDGVIFARTTGNAADIGHRIRIVAGLLFMLIPAGMVPTQDNIPALRVATRVVPPFVVERNGQLTGFSIELWTSIAERMKVRTSFLVSYDVRALLEAVRDGRADLGISAVSITSEADDGVEHREQYARQDRAACRSHLEKLG